MRHPSPARRGRGWGWGPIRSSIHLPHDGIEAADDRDEVRDQTALGAGAERVEGGERRGAEVAAVRPARAVGEQVDAELAARRLDALIDLANGRLVPLRHQFEVVD